MDLGRKEGYWVTKEGFDKIIQGVKAKRTPKKPITHKTAMQTSDDLQQQLTATQMTHTSTVNTVMQTAFDDEPLCPLSDVGTSTEPHCTCETAVQANNGP